MYLYNNLLNNNLVFYVKSVTCHHFIAPSQVAEGGTVLCIDKAALNTRGGEFHYLHCSPTRHGRRRKGNSVSGGITGIPSSCSRTSNILMNLVRDLLFGENVYVLVDLKLY
jgi:hypothetical protein